MSPSPAHAAPGTCIKFTVKSADEAAVVIRERLGPGARVLSVRNVAAGGLRGLWSAPRLEVIAQLALPETPAVSIATPSMTERKFSPGRDARPLAELLRRSGLSPAMLHRLQMSSAWPALAAAP